MPIYNPIGSAVAPTVGTKYYVSPTGNDTNDGLSSGSPWQTIARVNAATSFQPGDSILFQGGQVFTTSTGLNLTVSNCPQGGGSSSYPITIGSYSTGKATIKTTNNGIKTTNLQYINVQDLVIIGSSTGTYGTYSGIVFNNTNGTNSLLYGCNVTRCNISNFNYIGMFWNGNNVVNSGFSTSSITNCIVSKCVYRGISAKGTAPTDPGNVIIHQSLYVGGCVVFDCVGDVSYTSDGTGDGIAIGYCNNALIEYCSCRDSGYGGIPGGGGSCGIWLLYSTNSVIQFCEAYRHHSNTYNNADGAGFDLDLYCQNCIIQYCYAHDNQGAGILFYGASSGNIARFNTLVNNNTLNADAELRVHNCTGTQNIYDNTITGIYKGFRSISSAFLAQNNIVVLQAGGTLVTKDGTASQTFKNNGYWCLDSTCRISDNGTNYSSLSAWQSGKSQEMNGATPVGYFGDPKLSVPYSSSIIAKSYENVGIHNLLLTDFQLSSTSPLASLALDLGSSMGSLDFQRQSFSQPYTGPLGAYTLTIAYAYETETLTWKSAVETAGGSVSTALLAVDTYVKNCKSYGIWNAISTYGLLHVFATNGFTGLFIPLVNSFSATQTNNNFVSGDYSLNTGLTPGSANSTKWIDSGVICNNFASNASAALQFSGYVRSGANRDSTNYQCIVGVDNGTASRAFLYAEAPTSTSDNFFAQIFNSTSFVNPARSSPPALITAVRNSNTPILYNRGSVPTQNANGFTFANNPPTSTIGIGAQNTGGTPSQFMLNPFCYALIMLGGIFNATQEANHYTAVQALQSSLGRSV